MKTRTLIEFGILLVGIKIACDLHRSMDAWRAGSKPGVVPTPPPTPPPTPGHSIPIPDIDNGPRD